MPRPPKITTIERPWKVPRNHSLQRRQATTQNPDVHFQRRPDGRERVVPGDVRIVQEDQQGLQAQDRDDAGEAAEGEDCHEGYALAFGELELVEEGEGEDGDEDVCYYVYAGVGEPEMVSLVRTEKGMCVV